MALATHQGTRTDAKVGPRARDVPPTECAGQPALPELFVDVVEQVVVFVPGIDIQGAQQP
jgi:hypothetical protein